MRRVTVVFVLCVIVWMSTGFVKPAFGHPAEVLTVVPTNVEGAVHLTITIWHDVESSLHYVDTIEVTWGTNITSITINTKPLAPEGTFTVDYNMGLVTGTPTITVRARCTITGYSGAVSWTGEIPEQTPTLTPSPTPDISPSPSPSPTATPSPTPTISPSPSPTLTSSPSITPQQTSSASPTETSSPSPSITPTPSIPEFTSVIDVPILMALIIVGASLYRKRQLRR